MAKKRPQQSKKRRKDLGPPKKKGPCPVCSTGIDYKDTAAVRKYVSDRGKIRSRRVTGLCSACQREVARAVKNAREMALIPYIAPGGKPAGRGGRR